MCIRDRDGTEEIARRYEREYPDIVRVVSQENGGHGEAVNSGLLHAQGKYFKVVDSDDWLDEEALLKIMETLRKMCIRDRLEEGSMRADVNLSVREAGTESYGTRTEMKNLNSFKAIARAIEGETIRQIELLEEGKEVIQETRRWDDNKECSFPMRSKEDAKDYRYFPDPDLPPVVIDDAWIGRLKKEQPELREEKKKRFIREFSLSEYDARILTESRNMADLFEETAKICSQPKKAANWMTQDAMRLLKEAGKSPEEMKFSPGHLAAVSYTHLF